MGALVEEWDGPTMLIRLEPVVFANGIRWVDQTTVKIEDGFGTIKGFTGRATRRRLFAFIREVNKALNLPARYLRRVRPGDEYWQVQVAGMDGGKIVMKMKRTHQDRKPGRKMPHTDEAVQDDGKLNMDALLAAVPQVVDSFKSGEYTPVAQTVLDLGAVQPNLEAYVMLRLKNVPR